MPYDLRTQQGEPKWVVWYEDGSHTPLDGPYDDDISRLRRDGVMAITQRSPDGWEILRREDYYVWDYENFCWMGATPDAFWFYMRKMGPGKLVLFGHYGTQPQYWASMTVIEDFALRGVIP
jgi:hypothetical protein